MRGSLRSLVRPRRLFPVSAICQSSGDRRLPYRAQILGVVAFPSTSTAVPIGWRRYGSSSPPSAGVRQRPI